MRVTVCELPHEPAALAVAWAALCRHTKTHGSELVLLPEFATVEPVWEHEQFDSTRWSVAEAGSNVWLQRLPELAADHVVGTRPLSMNGRRLNQGYMWSAARRLAPLRSKYFLPDEPGNREARWFHPGDAAFPEFHVDDLSFGLNICTELWALDTYAAYAARGVQVILSPRATAGATTAKWLSVGVVAAVRSGAFCLSSNRVDKSDACGGVGWIIAPDGCVLASTSRDSPFATVDIDLSAATASHAGYPRYVFNNDNG